MHEIVTEAAALLSRVQRFHRTVLAHTIVLKELVETPALTQGDRADLAFLMREISNMMDHLRKETADRRRMLDRIMCIVWTKQCEEDDSVTRSIHGELATATPKIKMAANVPSPKNDPKGYQLLCEHFGLDSVAIEEGLMRVHWPSLTEHISQLAEDGLPLPPGVNIESMKPVYSTTLKGKEV